MPITETCMPQCSCTMLDYLVYCSVPQATLAGRTATCSSLVTSQPPACNCACRSACRLATIAGKGAPSCDATLCNNHAASELTQPRLNAVSN